jgi:hypothetical protein
MILDLLLGLGHRCLQILRSSCEGIINAIDELYDIFLFIGLYTKLPGAGYRIEYQQNMKSRFINNTLVKDVEGEEKQGALLILSTYLHFTVCPEGLIIEV